MQIAEDIRNLIVARCGNESGCGSDVTVADMLDLGYIYITPMVQLRVVHDDDLPDNMCVCEVDRIFVKRFPIMRGIASSESKLKDVFGNIMGPAGMVDAITSRFVTTITAPDGINKNSILPAIKYRFKKAHDVELPESLVEINDDDIREVMKKSDGVAYFDGNDFHLVPAPLFNGMDKTMWTKEDVVHMFGDVFTK